MVNKFADRGANANCFQSRLKFAPGTLKSCSPRTIILADESTVVASEIGEVIIPFEIANLRLKDVLLVPDIGYNLVSCGRLADKGIQSCFSSVYVTFVLSENNFQIGSGTRETKSCIYILPNPTTYTVPDNSLATNVNGPAELWHRRLAHMNTRDLQQVHKFADGVPKLETNPSTCRACRMGKAHKLPFLGHFMRSKKPGEIVHSDIVGSLDPLFPDGYRYIVTFLDDYSRYLYIGFMCCRSDLYEVFESVSCMFNKVGGVIIS